MFCLNTYLLPYYVYARSEGSDETARMRRLDRFSLSMIFFFLFQNVSISFSIAQSFSYNSILRDFKNAPPA